MEFTFGKVNGSLGYKPVSGWAIIFLPLLPFTLSSLNNLLPQWSFCIQIQPQQALSLLKHHVRVQPIRKSRASTVSHGSSTTGWSRPESGQWSEQWTDDNILGNSECILKPGGELPAKTHVEFWGTQMITLLSVKLTPFLLAYRVNSNIKEDFSTGMQQVPKYVTKHTPKHSRRATWTTVGIVFHFSPSLIWIKSVGLFYSIGTAFIYLMLPVCQTLCPEPYRCYFI